MRLLDAGGEFTAEVPTSATGHFRFFAGSRRRGRCASLAPGAEPVDRPVVAHQGVVAEVEIAI